MYSSLATQANQPYNLDQVLQEVKKEHAKNALD